MRAHPEPIGHYSPVARPPLTQAPDSPPIVLFVVPEPQRGLYAGDAFTRVYAHSSADAVRHVTASRPRVAVVDWDIPALGGLEVCAAARARPSTSVLVTTQTVEDAPAILRAGCHALLLKPFAPNLLAARLGRLLKETDRAWGQRSAPAGWQIGTNRVWPDTPCPNCNVRGATSFDFSSYRRMWYACLSCDHTWLGPRQE